MSNKDEWFWEVGDKFTVRAEPEPKTIYEVTEVLSQERVKCVNLKGFPSSATTAYLEPWVSPKLRKFVTLKAPWAPDPEDELLERAARLYEEASSDSLDNELVTADEAKLGTDIIRFIAEGKSRNPAELAASLALIHDLNFKRY